jgi:hypothetical protein
LKLTTTLKTENRDGFVVTIVNHLVSQDIHPRHTERPSVADNLKQLFDLIAERAVWLGVKGQADRLRHRLIHRSSAARTIVAGGGKRPPLFLPVNVVDFGNQTNTIPTVALPWFLRIQSIAKFIWPFFSNRLCGQLTPPEKLRQSNGNRIHQTTKITCSEDKIYT